MTRVEGEPSTDRERLKGRSKSGSESPSQVAQAPSGGAVGEGVSGSDGQQPEGCLKSDSGVPSPPPRTPRSGSSKESSSKEKDKKAPKASSVPKGGTNKAPKPDRGRSRSPVKFPNT